MCLSSTRHLNFFFKSRRRHTSYCNAGFADVCSPVLRRVLLNPPVDPARDHIRGPVDAPLTLVEYGDFECPFCGRATGAVEEVRERLGDRLRYVFRHLPLPDVNPRSEEHTSELQSRQSLVCRLLLEKKNKK